MKRQNLSRANIIQTLINNINGESYLEIGIGTGQLFKSIKCAKKVSVDPCISDGSESGNRKPTFKMTSDDFFNQNKDKFDVIFIDGLHEANQVEKDINNSLECLKNNGYIVCHDISPGNEAMQIVPRMQSHWNGDCWKAWVKIRSTNPNLEMFTVNIDHGCGVIKKGNQELLNLNGLSLDYENLDKNRKTWLNLVSYQEFIEKVF